MTGQTEMPITIITAPRMLVEDKRGKTEVLKIRLSPTLAKDARALSAVKGQSVSKIVRAALIGAINQGNGHERDG